MENKKFIEIIEKIDDNCIISFDVFDTLILRNLHKPTDVFKILEKQLSDKLGVKDFYKHRINAEISARKKAENGECNIDEIYEELSEVLNGNIQFAKQIELEIENKFLTTNPFMKEIYDYAMSKNKKIVFISDMYLSRDFIRNVLTNCGYKDVEIFISNEFRVNKGSGQLYKTVQEICGFDKSQWLHIGDSFQSDYEAAIKFGISAYNYKNVSTYEKSEPITIGESIIAGMKNNLLYNGKQLSYWESFGVKYVSPIYFGFSYWLYNLTNKNDNMFFLARDGYAIKEVYDEICKLNNNNIFTQYVYCSRQTVQMPAMALDKNMNFAVQFLTSRNELTDHYLPKLSELLKNAKIDVETVSEDLVRAFGFENLDDEVTIEKYHAAQKLAAYFSDETRENLMFGCGLTRKYFHQLGMNNFEKINVMDIGWSGNIQSGISKLLQKNVRGYYFGTIENKDFCDKFGWAFDCALPVENKTMVFDNVMMYELLFSAPHGSCLEYYEENGEIKPKLNDNNPLNKIIVKFQKSAIDLCRKLLQYYDYIDYISPEFCIAPYNDFVVSKNKNDVENFCDLSNDVAIGNSKKYPYVAKITEEDMKKGIHFLQAKKATGIWLGAFSTRDIDDNHRRILDYWFNHNYDEEYVKFNLSHSKIYFDFGNGFSEHESVIVKNIISNNKIKFNLELPLNVKAIRIDPTERKYITASRIKVAINKSLMKYTLSEHELKNYSNTVVFKTRDPNISVQFDGKMEMLEFSANIKILEN